MRRLTNLLRYATSGPYVTSWPLTGIRCRILLPLIGMAPSVGLLSDVLAVAARMPRVARWRTLGPETAVGNARQFGRKAGVRSTSDQARLRWAIGFVDRLCGANCYRRVLLEVSFDRVAAHDPVYFGLQSRDQGQPGHAWHGRDPALERQFEAIFQIL